MIRSIAPSRARLAVIAVLIVCLLGASSPAVLGAQTPAGTPDPVSPDDVYAASYRACDAAPRTFEDVTTMLSDADAAGLPVPGPLASPVTEGADGPVIRYELPDGAAPSPDDLGAAIATWEAGSNCMSYGQSLAYRSDDFVRRAVLTGTGGGALLSGLWDETHPSPAGSPYPEPITDGNGSDIEAPLPSQGPSEEDLFAARVGEPTGLLLYGARMVDPDHLAAYLDLDGHALVDGTFQTIQPLYDQIGYIAFVRAPDGRWLIDDLVSPYPIVNDRLYPDATPAA